MRIGLMRHFKVQINTNKNWINSFEFLNWIKEYDQSDIHISSPEVVKIKWGVCYSSDLYRAIKTAESIYKGEIFKTDQLREIEINPLFDSRLKFHLNVWLILGRLGWLLNHQSQESKDSTFKRAQTILNDVEENNPKNQNVLIVTHGAFMTVLKRELLHRGYQGDKFTRPRNGMIYTYTKDICE